MVLKYKNKPVKKKAVVMEAMNANELHCGGYSSMYIYENPFDFTS